MAGAIHFEVFFKKNRKSGWALYEARDDRDEAMKLAHDLVAKHKDGSVRVTKERFDDEARTFRSMAIFESGTDAFKDPSEKTGEATLPCLTPDDLSKPHARHTMRRVLSGWFERMQALPMELLHRPDLVENLESSDTTLQHAIQKVAVASANDSDASVHGFVKQLNELVQKSLNRIYKDGRDKKLPDFPKQARFSDIADKVYKADRRAYSLRAAMADRLRHEKNYGSKLEALLDMADQLPECDEARGFAIGEVDSYLAEVISFDAGREALLGKCKDLGETMEKLACLADGDHGADAIVYAPRAAKRLAEKIATKEFPACRAIIADEILKELERPQRFRPNSVKAEVRLSRDLARKLIMCADSTLPADKLSKAFATRSARLLRPDTIDDFLRDAKTPDEELSRLVALEENIVGETNKQKLAGYIRTMLTSQQVESAFVRGIGQPLERLAQVTALQARVLKGSYPKDDKSELASCFDKLGMKIIDESKILNMVEAGDRPALDKATGLLKLVTGGALPLGHCSADAQARALRQLKSGMGLSEAQDPEGRGKLQLIQSMLQQVATNQAKLKTG